MSTSETLAGWAGQIHEESEVPEAFAEAFKRAELGQRPFPLVIYSPTFRFDQFEIAPRLFAVTRDRAVCLEEHPEGVRVGEVYLPWVHWAEWGTELLNSWLRLEALGPMGASAVRIDFNTASRDLFQLVLDSIRSTRYRGLHTDIERELEKFEPLNRLDFKLMTFGCQCIVDGALVHRFHLQTRVSSTGPSGQLIIDVPASLAVLTQKELIFIREGDARDTGYYAGAFHFLDLARIERLEIVPVPDRPLLSLRALLPGGSVASSEYAREGEPGLRAFACEVVKRKLSAGP